MSNQTYIISLIKSMSGQANILTIPRIYIDITDGDHLAALFLSQCIYWSDKGSKEWFYKSDREWEEELGLSHSQVSRIRKKLDPILKTKVKRANGAPTTHYMIDFRILTNLINEKLTNGLIRNSLMDIEESDKSLTDSTSENIQENTINSPASLSAAFWSASGIPEPAFGSKGHTDWMEGLERLAKIKATPDEVTAAVKILVSGSYRISDPGSAVKTIVNTRNTNKAKAKNQKQSLGGQFQE